MSTAAAASSTGVMAAEVSIARATISSTPSSPCQPSATAVASGSLLVDLDGGVHVVDELIHPCLGESGSGRVDADLAVAPARHRGVDGALGGRLAAQPDLGDRGVDALLQPALALVDDVVPLDQVGLDRLGEPLSGLLDVGRLADDQRLAPVP